MAQTNGQRKIAYLVKTFPKFSETFILNEILELERQGVNLHIFSLKTPADEHNHRAVNDVQAQVTYIPVIQSDSEMDDRYRVLWQNILLFFSSPRRYFVTVVTLFRRWESLCPSPGKFWSYVKTAVAFLLRRHYSSPSSRKLRKLLQAGFIARTVLREDIQHLHAHFANIPTSVAELVSLLTGVPYSFTAHAKDIYLTEARELDRKINGAEFVLTCTGFNRNYLQGLSTSSTPIILAHHGIDLGFFDSGSWTGDDCDIPPLILGVGRLCEKKGFRYLVEACSLLKAKGLDFHCDIVGYGPGKDDLKQQIAQLGLKAHVRLPGKMTQHELLEVYHRASIFALPCQVTDDGDRDGIPNVLIEAMALRLPVVSTDISGISELVDHMESGILVKQKDPGELAQAIEFLLQRPELRLQFGIKGREKVLRHFSLERNVCIVRDKLMGVDRQEAPATEGSTKGLEVKPCA